MTNDRGHDRYRTRAVERTLDLLDLLKTSPQGLSLMEATQELGLPRATAFRYLHTLEARGYVVRSERTGRYWPGPAFQRGAGVEPPDDSSFEG
jgi:IclR family acetate operon transcriptional repressor